jgi:hypothetical protein
MGDTRPRAHLLLVPYGPRPVTKSVTHTLTRLIWVLQWEMHINFTRLQLMYTNRRHTPARVSNDSVMWDAMIETHDLCVSILHVGASWMRLYHVVGVCCRDGTSRPPVMAALLTVNTHHGGQAQLGDSKSQWFPELIKSIVPPPCWSTMSSLSWASTSSPPRSVISKVSTLGFGHPRASCASDLLLRPSLFSSHVDLDSLLQPLLPSSATWIWQWLCTISSAWSHDLYSHCCKQGIVSSLNIQEIVLASEEEQWHQSTIG